MLRRIHMLVALAVVSLTSVLAVDERHVTKSVSEKYEKKQGSIRADEPSPGSSDQSTGVGSGSSTGDTSTTRSATWPAFNIAPSRDNLERRPSFGTLAVSHVESVQPAVSERWSVEPISPRSDGDMPPSERSTSHFSVRTWSTEGSYNLSNMSAQDVYAILAHEDQDFAGPLDADDSPPMTPRRSTWGLFGMAPPRPRQPAHRIRPRVLIPQHHVVVPNRPQMVMRQEVDSDPDSSDEELAELPTMRRMDGDAQRPTHAHRTYRRSVARFTPVDPEVEELRRELLMPYASRGVGGLMSPGRPSMRDIARAREDLAEMTSSQLLGCVRELQELAEADEMFRELIGDHILFYQTTRRSS